MKRPAVLAVVAAGILVLGATGWFFITQVGGAGREEAAAVILSAPPDFFVMPAGRLDAAATAGALAVLASQEPARRKLGVHATAPDGSQVILLLDRDADLLDQRTAGPTGTRTQTVWHGRFLDRLERARTTGDLDLPGLPPGEKKNLYH